MSLKEVILGALFIISYITLVVGTIVVNILYNNGLWTILWGGFWGITTLLLSIPLLKADKKHQYL